MTICLSEKIAEAIAPIKEKTNEVVTAQIKMKEQVDLLMGEVSTLRGKVTSLESEQNVTIMSQLPKAQFTVQREVAAKYDTLSDDKLKLDQVTSLGRRTVGLFKIDQTDLLRLRQPQYGGAKSEDEEKLFAVREYLQLELKIHRDTIDEMAIDNIFRPAKGDLQCLYATFSSVSSVQKYMKKQGL